MTRLVLEEVKSLQLVKSSHCQTLYCLIETYSQEYGAVKDVPIVSATAVQDQAVGETHIIMKNERMWYGNWMNHS